MKGLLLCGYTLNNASAVYFLMSMDGLWQLPLMGGAGVFNQPNIKRNTLSKSSLSNDRQL